MVARSISRAHAVAVSLPMAITPSLLIPPFRFESVEEGIYRSAYPTQRNFRFLRRLHLKTIVSLVPAPDEPCAELRAFCASNGIRLLAYDVARFKDHVPLTAVQVARMLEVLIDRRNSPLLVHCLNGMQVTGVVVMCLRKLQNWTVSSIFTEYSRFVSLARESEFVENFAARITIPPPSLRVPWLFHGQSVTRHPTLRLRFAPADSAHDPDAATTATTTTTSTTVATSSAAAVTATAANTSSSSSGYAVTSTSTSSASQTTPSPTHSVSSPPTSSTLQSSTSNNNDPAAAAAAYAASAESSRAQGSLHRAPSPHAIDQQRDARASRRYDATSPVVLSYLDALDLAVPQTVRRSSCLVFARLPRESARLTNQ